MIQRQDENTRALITVSHAINQINVGNHFYNEKFVDVPADDVLDIRFITPNSDKRLYWIIDYNTEAEFHMTFYENISIVVPGTDLDKINNNRNSLISSGLIAFDYIINTTVTLADDDTGITNATIIGTGATGSGRSQAGSAFGEGGELVLKENTGYSLRFENQNAATDYVDWKIEWFEHYSKEE